MRILLTGGSGLLALNWAVSERENHELFLGIHHRAIQLNGSQSVRLELASPKLFGSQLATISPELVVHTAGLTSVERCESEPQEAQAINTVLASTVASACSEHAIPLIHISTDHLFRGHLPNQVETSKCDPVNWYGRSKARAEKEVTETCPSALIVRTNFFGWGTSYRRSISDWILDGLRKSQPLSLFEDVFFTPIHALEVTRTVMELHKSGSTGIFHVVGDERISKLEFGRRLARRFGYDETILKPVSFSSKQGLVTRPMDMSLSNWKACSVLGRSLGDLDFHIEQLAKQKASGIAGELGKL